MVTALLNAVQHARCPIPFLEQPGDTDTAITYATSGDSCDLCHAFVLDVLAAYSNVCIHAEHQPSAQVQHN